MCVSNLYPHTSPTNASLTSPQNATTTTATTSQLPTPTATTNKKTKRSCGDENQASGRRKSGGGKRGDAGPSKSRKGAYRCEYCHKVFGYQQNLNQHRRMHTGDKYACAVCGKQFNFSQNLHQHMRVHSGKKEYKCSYCCKEFNDAANFHRHKRVIHGISGKGQPEPAEVASNPHPHMRPTDDVMKVSMPFACPRCAMCFVLNSSLQKHLQHCVSPAQTDEDGDDRRQEKAAAGGTEQQESGKSGAKRKRENRQQNGKIASDWKKAKLTPQLEDSQTTALEQEQEQENGDKLFSRSCAYTNTSPTAVSSFSSCALSSESSPPASTSSAPYCAAPDVSIYVCPYCGFGVTNSLVFREHLMHHRDGICHQYRRLLASGRASFDGILGQLMRSSAQPLNPASSPIIHSSSSPSSSSSSPSELVSPPAAGLRLHNTPIDGQMSPYVISPDSTTRWLQGHVMHKSDACGGYQQHPGVQTRGQQLQQQATVGFQQVSPSSGLPGKHDMDDSGCVVEGEVSPWRLHGSAERSGDSPTFGSHYVT